MVTDILGKPIGGENAEFKLSLQQKRQATLLYHWMSLDYLKRLKDMIDALIHGADVNLELAKRQGRDALLANDRWGVRDTSANWSTYAFPALEDFRNATIKDITLRSMECYEFTGANQCGRMLAEFSSMWMSSEEEAAFKEQFEAVYHYAQFIDFSAGVGGTRHHLHDCSMAMYWLEHSSLFERLPKFRVRTDIQGTSHKKPPRTGVYVAQDDELATLQFAWVGNDDGVLGDSQTLNEAGRKMVAAVGRDAMWLDGERMAAYATEAFRRGELSDRGGFEVGDESDPQWVRSILSSNAHTSRPCQWYFVEQVEGEFDDEADSSAIPAKAVPALRCEAGQPCPMDGWWSTPAKAGSRRRFAAGELMPSMGGDYGTTIWQMEAGEGD